MKFWNWDLKLKLKLKLSFVIIALCMNDFLCSSIFTDKPTNFGFSLLCLFFSLCYSLCLLPFSWDVFCFRMLLSSWGQCMHHVQDPFGLCWSRCWVECWIGHGCDWSYQLRWIVLGLPGVEISVLWGSALLMSRKSFRDLSVMARLKSCRIWHLIWMVLRVCPGVNRTLWRWLTLCWRPLWSWKGFWRGCKSM